MRIYCCQHDVSWEDKAANFGRVASLLASARPEPGSLLVLPEMFATGFSMNSAALAEDPGASETLAFLGETARTWGCPALAGLVLREGDACFNEAVLVSEDGALAGRYAKMHPFTFAGEDRSIEAGRAVAGFEVGGEVVTPFICYDLRFPEVFRAADSSSVLFVVIANWPAARIAHWLTLLRARAIENQAFVVGVNRVGTDPKVDYCGRSVVIDARGEIVADAGGDETVLSIDLDLQSARRWREEFPAQRDRRPLVPAPAD